MRRAPRIGVSTSRYPEPPPPRRNSGRGLGGAHFAASSLPVCPRAPSQTQARWVRARGAAARTAWRSRRLQRGAQCAHRRRRDGSAFRHFHSPDGVSQAVLRDRSREGATMSTAGVPVGFAPSLSGLWPPSSPPSRCPRRPVHAGPAPPALLTTCRPLPSHHLPESRHIRPAAPSLRPQAPPQRSARRPGSVGRVPGPALPLVAEPHTDPARAARPPGRL